MTAFTAFGLARIFASDDSFWRNSLGTSWQYVFSSQLSGTPSPTVANYKLYQFIMDKDAAIAPGVWQFSNGQAGVWLMNGTEITTAAALGGANGTNFAVRGIGDLNGDGRGDIVWQFADGQAGAWLMNGTTISGGNAIGGANGSNVQIRDVADLNGDGLMDLVWQDVTNGQAIGFLMNGTTITSAGLIGGANGADWFIV
jgi:hypothetical protein